MNRSIAQVPTCLQYTVAEASHRLFLLVKRQAGKLCLSIFMVFGLIRPGIAHESTVSEANGLSTQLQPG